MVWDSHLLKNFSVCWVPHSQRLGVVSEGKLDIFVEFSCFFYDPADFGFALFF